jgi:hypothetical protein
MATVTPFEVELVSVQYTAKLELLLQQKGTRVAGAVSRGNYVGKYASPVQYASALEFRTPGPRGSALQPQLAQYQRRWVSPIDKSLPVQVDTFDELRTIVDPKSALTAAVKAAANRLFDDVVIAAFFGSALTGPDATNFTTETFNSGSDFPISVAIADTFGVGTATGLTIKKLIEANRILERYENDMDEMRPHIAIGAQQHADLLGQIEATSEEYRAGLGVNRDGSGNITSILGFQIHRSQRLATSGSDRLCPVWMEGGMHLGVWKGVTTIVSQRTDLEGHPWQAYSMVSLGATRLQGGQVIQIACYDTGGNDITV